MLTTAVKGIIEIIQKPGYINVDFEDVMTMMKDSGMALMGYGEGSGPNRVEDAVRQAFESPLLNDFDLKTARNVLVNITGGKNEQGLTMDDMSEINRRIDEYTGGANNFKRGLIWDEDPNVGDHIHITSIVTGLKFIDIVGSRRDMGNYIMISRDFKYDKNEDASTRGIRITEDPGGSRIGYSSTDNQRLFRFDPGKRPVLAVTDRDPISDLENTPAIRRS